MIGLIAAFYVPSQGRVLVDGIDLSTVNLNTYRTQLGVVLQETFLFDGTIREKYNVVTRSSETQVNVGYSQNQVGFGWTNGTYLVLRHELSEDAAAAMQSPPH